MGQAAIFQIVGGLVMVAGVAIFTIRNGSDGTTKLIVLGQELHFSAQSLLIFIGGLFLFVLPFTPYWQPNTQVVPKDVTPGNSSYVGKSSPTDEMVSSDKDVNNAANSGDDVAPSPARPPAHGASGKDRGHPNEPAVALSPAVEKEPVKDEPTIKEQSVANSKPVPAKNSKAVLAQQFPYYDKDGNQTLSLEEFVGWLSEMKTGQNIEDLSPAQIRKWAGDTFKRADANNSNAVSLRELQDLLVPPS